MLKSLKRRAWLLLCAGLVVVGIVAPTADATSVLRASKTATGHWEVKYRWTIDKSVTPDVHNLQTRESGTSTYTVAVEKILDSESVWVEGQICVTNRGTTPTSGLNIWDQIEALNGSGGLISTGAMVSVDVSGNPVLDPNESHCYAYKIQFTPVAGAASYRNRAFVRAAGVATVRPTAMFNIPASPTVVLGSINVNDTNGMSWPFSSSGSQTYTKTFTCDGDEGEHRNTAIIVETGQSDSAKVTVNCTPPPDPGCTRTQGYWKTHSKYGPAPLDPTWAAIGEDTPFSSSGMSWYQLFHTSPTGNAYIILAHQYMAALLNKEAGADTSEVDDELAWANTFFSTHGLNDTLSDALRSQVIEASETLEDYNEGAIGPGHCPED